MFWLISFIILVFLYKMLLTDEGGRDIYNYREYEDEKGYITREKNIEKRD